MYSNGVLQHFNKKVLAHKSFAEAIKYINTDFDELIERIGVKISIPPEQVWALVLDWLMVRFQDKFKPCRQAQRMLQAQLRMVDTVKKAAVINEITAYLSSVTPDAWNVTNTEACSA
jgi:hypothetical protein